MRFNKILLVNFYYRESGYGDRLNFPPVGMGYISEYLDAHEIQHEVIDMGAGATHEDILKFAFDYQPDLIGASINSVNLRHSVDNLQRIKNVLPNVKIVVGGPHVNTKETEFLDKYKQIDFGILKEGEIPLLRLCKGDRLSKIPGLIWRDGVGSIVVNPPVMHDIDTIPFPKYKHFQMEGYASQSIPLISSRGCPFSCIFCQQSALLGKKWRGRKAVDFVDEITWWVERGIRSFHILDDMFSLDRNRVLEIADLIEKRNHDWLELLLIPGVRVRNTDRELLEAFKRIGIVFLSFGIESASDKVLKFIRKGMTAAEADEVVSMAVEMGFKVRLFFIIGFPYETVLDVQKSFDFALRYNVHEVRFFNLMPYEDTELMAWLNENDANFLFPYDSYMSEFKQYLRTPVFDAPFSMSVDEKSKALGRADEIIRIVEDKNRQSHLDEN